MQSGMKELPIDVTQGLFGSVLDSLLDYIAGLVGRLMAHSVGGVFYKLARKTCCCFVPKQGRGCFQVILKRVFSLTEKVLSNRHTAFCSACRNLDGSSSIGISMLCLMGRRGSFSTNQFWKNSGSRRAKMPAVFYARARARRARTQNAALCPVTPSSHPLNVSRDAGPSFPIF